MTITAHELPQCDGNARSALAGGAEGGERNLVVFGRRVPRCFRRQVRCRCANPRAPQRSQTPIASQVLSVPFLNSVSFDHNFKRNRTTSIASTKPVWRCAVRPAPASIALACSGEMSASLAAILHMLVQISSSVIALYLTFPPVEHPLDRLNHSKIELERRLPIPARVHSDTRGAD